MIVAYAHHASDDAPAPVSLADLKKSIVVPRPDFEGWLEGHDWTIHQLARSEFPPGFSSLEECQWNCICGNPYLWCRMFLREPEDPDHEEPYNFWPYQVESLEHDGSCVHKDGSEVGKTREIIAWVLHKAFTIRNGSGLIGAPLQTHLDEIIEGMYDQLLWNKDLFKSLRRWKKHPHHAFYFTNFFKIDFRPSGHDGIAYRGVHARTFAIKDEAAKDKHEKQWSEFWRAMKPSCVARIYSVPDGDRSCEFYKLGQRATPGPGPGKPRQGRAASDVRLVPAQASPEGYASAAPASTDPPKEEVEIESLKSAAKHIKALKFRLFRWPKSFMPAPYWSDERRRFYIDQYGGEDSAAYKHNVLGEDGDPEHTVFPWHQFRLCVKEIPEYRCLKVLVDAGNNEVMATGYRCELAPTEGDILPRQAILLDEVYMKSLFFDLDDDSESPFRRLIKSFFSYVPGFKRGGADLGFSGDPTEITMTLVLGKRERKVARLHLKHVTYDQQCQAIDALDDLYTPDETIWGTDFGNAGSAVAHDLQGLPQYEHKNYDDRLHGYQFGSTTDNVDEEDSPIIDAKTGKPAKITLKELATDLLIKKMQRQELEYPPDPDFAFFYPNHTVRQGDRHRIFKGEDDHLIDSDRLQVLAGLVTAEGEDIFA